MIGLAQFSTGIVFRFRFLHLFGVGLFLGLFSLGAWITHHNTFNQKRDYFGKYEGQLAIACIDEALSEKEKTYKSVLELQTLIDKDRVTPVKGKVLVYFEKDSLSRQLRIGDQIIIRNAFQEVQVSSNPGQFDYRQYLAFHQIYHQVYLARGKWSRTSEVNHHWLKELHELRSSMLQILLKKWF